MTEVEYGELMHSIAAAFRDVPIPAENDIVSHDCPECRDLAAAVRGRTAEELSDEWVNQNFDQLPLFTDNAKRYYLPAFLRVAAAAPDSTVAIFVLFALSTNFRMQPSGGYSEPQKRAIRDYLRFVEPAVEDFDKEDFAKAMTAWGQQ